MSRNGDRESWSVVPDSGGQLWASDSGQVARLKYDGAGFNILSPRMDQFGELYVLFKAGGKGANKKRFIGALVLAAFVGRRPGSRRVGFRDGNPGNCELSNLAWVRRGEGRVVDLIKRRCLGKNCGVEFMSEGAGHRLCPACSKRAADSTSNIFEDCEVGDLPDDPLIGGGHQR